MKQKNIIRLILVGLLSLPFNVQAQTSGSELFKKAITLLKRGNCDDARQAMELFKRAKKEDSNLIGDCDKNILKCQTIIQKGCGSKESLELSQNVVEIPYQGGESQIGVMSSRKWNISNIEEWLTARPGEKNSFVISCLEQNNSTRERISTIKVTSGSYQRELKVIQAARPEYIDVDAVSLNFPSSGTTERLSVKSNAEWDITSVPSWCTVEKGDSSIIIIVSPNERVLERNDDIIIVSPNKQVTIRIFQGAGDEKLTLSQNNINIPSTGGKHYVKVYTDAENWFIGDFPNWLNVQRINNDSICIESRRFIAYSGSDTERSGSVQIKTGRQTQGIMVTQEALPIQYIVCGGNKTIPGRNYSLGFNASYAMPFVNASAGGDYEGSVVDYSVGTSTENASYKKAVGYSFGLFADIRLGRNSNLFLMPGINFTQIKYENEFNLPTTYTSSFTSYQYLRGDVMNSYKEEYSHTMIEVPILASYRFKLNDFSHVQLNLGPVLNFGITSKMKFSGNTDSETLHLYNNSTNMRADNSNYVRHTSTNAEFNLYQPCVLWTESYTTGNVAEVQHHDTFNNSPLHRFNWGLRAGAAYEIAGLSFGIYYTMMLSNMANDGYWSNKRWTVLNESNAVMKGYKQHIHTLEFKLSYTLRYIGKKKN